MDLEKEKIRKALSDDFIAKLNEKDEIIRELGNEVVMLGDLHKKAMDDELRHKQEALDNLRGQFDLQLHIEKNALQQKMDNIERDKEK